MNTHIRTDTSPEREAHLRVLAETDNALRDAMAMLNEQKRLFVELGRSHESIQQLRHELLLGDLTALGLLLDAMEALCDDPRTSKVMGLLLEGPLAEAKRIVRELREDDAT